MKQKLNDLEKWLSEKTSIKVANELNSKGDYLKPTDRIINRGMTMTDFEYRKFILENCLDWFKDDPQYFADQKISFVELVEIAFEEDGILDFAQ